MCITIFNQITIVSSTTAPILIAVLNLILLYSGISLSIHLGDALGTEPPDFEQPKPFQYHNTPLPKKSNSLSTPKI